MKLWISKETDTPIRDQLVTQVTLAISSGDIKKGARLPSRGELARRFGIHENTVSNAYKVLSDRGLIEFRKGSGFFASDTKNSERRSDLEWLTAEFLRAAFRTGADNHSIRQTFLNQIENRMSHGITVLEDDADLREILIHEISDAIGETVDGLNPSDLRDEKEKEGNFVALVDERRKIEDLSVDCLYLKSRSIPEALVGRKKPPEDALIALVSGWDGFLRMARTILMAVKIDPDSVLIRSTKESKWDHGLNSAALIIADSLAATQIQDGNDERIRVFHFISDESIAELNRLVSELDVDRESS